MYTRKGIIGSLSIALAVGLLCVAFAPKAHASLWNQQTTVTFSQPVEVPGHVLPAGTYTFKLLGGPSSRNIVEILNKNQTKLYAIVMAEAAYRQHPTSKTVMTLEERPAGCPEAIHKWFYPGTKFGHDFIYQHSQTSKLAMKHSKKVSANG